MSSVVVNIQTKDLTFTVLLSLRVVQYPGLMVLTLIPSSLFLMHHLSTEDEHAG